MVETLLQVSDAEITIESCGHTRRVSESCCPLIGLVTCCPYQSGDCASLERVADVQRDDLQRASERVRYREGEG